MPEADVIRQVHAEAVAVLFRIFSQGFIAAEDDAERERTRMRFLAGLRKAREIRDLALESLPCA